MSEWPTHMVRAGSHIWSGDHVPADTEELRKFKETHRQRIEPWLSALVQAEHLNLLIGSGLTTAIASHAGVQALDMGEVQLECEFDIAVNEAANRSAKRSGRGKSNIEDQIRVVGELIAGLRILAGALKKDDDPGSFSRRAACLLILWENTLGKILADFLKKILKTECVVRETLDSKPGVADRLRRLLGSFLLTFASRAASRERLHIFTTNYDRLIECGCDLLGLRILDRFVGSLLPVFRSSRLGVDFHYNPPGIRGEPRYLEGVVRLTKLHGSVDWRKEGAQTDRTEIRRTSLPFGADENHPDVISCPSDSLMIYPNPAKDVETLEYPYADLFRDFAAAACQPNAVVVTYGYGFGDDHVNRILRDMLTIPSTHLAILSYDSASGRIRRFCDAVGREEQVTLLLGCHFGDLLTLADNYLPKPAIDRTTWRMVELINRRTPNKREDGPSDTDGTGVEVKE